MSPFFSISICDGVFGRQEITLLVVQFVIAEEQAVRPIVVGVFLQPGQRVLGKLGKYYLYVQMIDTFCYHLPAKRL